MRPAIAYDFFRQWSDAAYFLRLCLFVGAAALVTAVGVTALRSATGNLGLPLPLFVLEQRLPAIFPLHMVAAAIGLILLPWTLLLRRRRAVHRMLGRATAACLLLGIAAALPSAFASVAPPAARLAFVVQAVLCLAFLLRALLSIRSGNAARHARNMVRMSALIFAAVGLRILMFASAMAEMPFEATYQIAAWLSWLVPLLAVCAGQMWRRRPPAQAAATRSSY